MKNLEFNFGKNDDINPINKFGVAVGDKGIMILMPPTGPMSQDDAILLAAWLVALSNFGRARFETYFKAVIET